MRAIQRAGFRHEPVPENLARLLADRTAEPSTIGRSGDAVLHLHGVAGEPGAYLKIGPRRIGSSLHGEHQRLAWLAGHLPVPEVLLYTATERYEYLLTTEIQGTHAAEPDGHGDIHHLIASLARGLHRFHSLATDTCPFDSRFPALLEHARQRMAAGHINPDEFDTEYRGRSARSIIDELEQSGIGEEQPVVLHGDYSLPNIITADGAITGFIDLGGLGVGDRHHDLVCAAWSIAYNAGEAYLPEFFEAYGAHHISPERFRLYHLLNQVL